MKIYKLFFLPTFLFFYFFGMANSAKNNYQNAIDGRLVKDSTPITCSKTPEIEKIIAQAISLGAPLYNEGLHLACYRVYEWAAYKILYVHGGPCKNVEAVLKAAVDKSHGDYSDTEKAWLMRAAFDKIMGVPTQTKPEEEELPLKNG